MIPLGSSSLAITLAALVAARAGPVMRRRWLIVAELSAIGVMVTYPLFFAAANAVFARGGLSDPELRAILDRWATWHWVRTALGLLGFDAALRALQRP